VNECFKQKTIACRDPTLGSQSDPELAKAGAEVTQLIQVVNLWKMLDAMKIVICSITCGNMQFRVRRQMVQCEKSYMNLSLNIEATYSKQFPLKISSDFQYVWRKDGG